MSVVLIGMMGVGKTTLGSVAAARIGFRFVDLDAYVEKKAGKPIARVFEEEGEAAFRSLEHQALCDLSEERRIILSVGGGAVLRRENFDLMRLIGKIIYLRADAEVLAKRLRGSEQKRPLLQGGDIVTKVRTLLEERTPLYEQADVILDIDGRSRLEMIERIGEVALLRR